VKTSCSMVSQLLKLFPRSEFEGLVRDTGAQYAAKGFTSWSQMVAMLFCQFGRAHSLREIEGGLKSCEGKLAHLGIEAPARSRLSYANARRPWQLFEAVFYGLYEKVSATVGGGRRKFRFKNKLVSIDSTVIDLSLSMYDWAKYQRTKGAVKLHLVLDHDGYLPCFGVLTGGTVADVRVAQALHFEPGTIVVDDRGYNDYALFSRWCGQDGGVVHREDRVADTVIDHHLRAAVLEPVRLRRLDGLHQRPAGLGVGGVGRRHAGEHRVDRCVQRKGRRVERGRIGGRRAPDEGRRVPGR